MSISTLNPATDELIQEFEPMGEDEINRRIDLAQAAFLDWRKTPFNIRSQHFIRLASILRARSKELSETITLEMGKPIRESEAEIEKCALVCEYYADNAHRFLADEIIPTEAGKSFVSHEPLGIILAIMPWNFPFWQVFRFAVPSLMAGNTALLKHASNVPLCALALSRLFQEAGFPLYVFQSLLITSSQTEYVISDDHIKAVTLTGSELAGSKVASLAGKHIKKTVLELGGSDPLIVLKDADLEKAANTAIKSRMINSGQSCIAAKRFIVEAAVHDRFLDLIMEKTMQLNTGDPMKSDTDVGPMARKDLADILLSQISRSLEAGAKLITGGTRLNRKGFFVAPTILSNVSPGMPAFDQEIFGPAACVINAKNENDAIELANLSFFGLGAAIWTRDMVKAEQVARQIDAGCVFVNDLVRSDPRVPFGGIKRSGYGRELSSHGIKEFVNHKTIWIA